MKRTLSIQLSNMVGQEVTVKGWVYQFRKLGKMSFLVIRERTGYIQVFIPKGIINETLHIESVVEVTGTVKTEPQSKYNGIEIVANTVTVISSAEILPFPINHAEGAPEVPFPTQYKFRPLTLRGEKERAIFKIQSEVIFAFREYFKYNGFTEIQSSKISASGLEGGSNLFELNYFGEKMFLTQSPQFYKQMMCGVYERVFEVGKVYRAEGSNTRNHMTEFVGLDVEMGFIENFNEVMSIEEGFFEYLFAYLNNVCSEELALFNINELSMVSIPRLTYNEVIEIVANKYNVSGVGINSEVERLIGEYVKEKYNSEFLFITHYPIEEKPFYTMPSENGLTESFDLLYKGVEITSGGQRIHNYEQLVSSIKSKALNAELFESYLMPFKYGMPPHGGFGIGAERILKQMLNLNSAEEASLIPRTKERFIH